MDEKRDFGMIEYKKIKKFKTLEVFIHTLYVYEGADKALLIDAEIGTTLAVSSSVANELYKGKISDDFAFLLVQRGMANYKNSRSIVSKINEIRPDFFLIDLTKECNLKCRYCFRNSNVTKKTMSIQMLEQICNSIVAFANVHPERQLTIQLWGGEPLLEIESIIHVREFFRNAGLNPEITIETNATLISKKIARCLYQNKIGIGVSIDGNALVHDLQRPTKSGNPSLNAVVLGIKNLYSAGYRDIGSISVVTANTVDNLEQVIDFLVKDLNLRRIKLNLMRQNKYNRDYAVKLDEIDIYVEKLLKCLRKYWKEKIPMIEQNVSQRLFNLLYRPNNNICNACGCHGGYRMLSIDSLGNVYPCELDDYPDYKIGNVKDEDFDLMVKNAQIQGMEYFKSRDTNDCQECAWWYYCRGGCRAAAKYDTGSSQNVDKTECAYNRAIYPRLVKVLLDESEFANFLMEGDNS